MALQFTRLRGTLKEQLDIEIGPCTIVVGLNESWKTTIPETLELAVLGTKGEHRIGGTAKDLLRLAPAALRATGLFAGAYGPEGDAVFTLRGSASHTLPAVLATLTPDDRKRCFVAKTVLELLAPRSANARAAFIRLFGAGDLAKVPMPVGLTDEQQKHWRIAVDEATKRAGADADPAMVLAEMTSWASAAQRAASARANVLDDELVKLRSSVLNTTTVAPERVAELEAQLATARKHDGASATRSSIGASLAEAARLDAGVLAASAEAVAAGARVAALETAIEPARAVLKTATARLAEIEQRLHRATGVVHAMNYSLDHGAEGCFACSTQAPYVRVEVAKRRDALGAQITARTKERESAAEAVLTAENVLRGIQLDLDRARADQATCAATAANAKSKAAESRKHAETLTLGLPRIYDGPPTADLEARLDQARKASLTLEAQETTARTARAKRVEAQLWALVNQEATLLQKTMVDRLIGKAIAEVQTYMPHDLRVSVELDGKGVLWSVQADGGEAAVYGAASGREEGALTIAAAAVVARGLPWSVLSLDDRMLGVFDADRIRQMAERCGEMQAKGLFSQVMLTWNRPSELRGVSGYTVIERSRRPAVA